MTTALTLRLPDELHEALRKQAFDERTTITALILAALTDRPKPGTLCDERACWNKPTRVVSGGFHFCADHGPTDVPSEEASQLERGDNAPSREGTMIGHVFEGERCIHCNVNIYDDTTYGSAPCVEREPMTYTTETPQPLPILEAIEKTSERIRREHRQTTKPKGQE